ncbi:MULTISPECIES: heavy-metal-associated domain-containing protein [Paracoccaceae]|jgi:copper chaperone|uniref:heavy-metal-associated domain-containing protein n=1 Tax=Paracoccaceae TaxID=31989 RepID=UPI001571F8B1|nr:MULTISPECIES: heavy-metal-associated domain-containing protein [Paracoccaceae]MBJ2153887.1 heavy-metal-associated domain-containing protein [Paracoccus sp. IB05]NTT88469.1 heavy-metal-associated domain-containing protein [Tabrizicola sp. SY72]
MQFHVESMTCGGCARSVTKAIESVDAQAKIETDPPTRTVKVETSATQDDILKVLDLAGYPATAK